MNIVNNRQDEPGTLKFTIPMPEVSPEVMAEYEKMLSDQAEERSKRSFAVIYMVILFFLCWASILVGILIGEGYGYEKGRNERLQSPEVVTNAGK